MPKWPKITWTSSPLDHFAQDGQPYILGINPWIYDFAAYNFWSRPAGLLVCLDLLRQAGANIALLDCLDQTWSDIVWPNPLPYGQGHYLKTPIPKPRCYADIPRNYSRYGLPFEAVKGALQRLQPKPDCVVLGSIMTYWYPGVMAMVYLIREIWPKVPIVLGGIYATLCNDHARGQNLVDLIIQGPLENPCNWEKFWQFLGHTPPILPENNSFVLARDLYPAPKYSMILGSRGCPFSCPYCANKCLYPHFFQDSFDHLWDNLEEELRRGVQNFAFYDDAALIRPQTWLLPLLKLLAQRNKNSITLHAPNALHIRYLSTDLARLLKKAGLKTVRLGLETADFHNRNDQKLTYEEWQYGLRALYQAGFQPDQIGAYILFGLPEQDKTEIEQAISFVQKWGIRPHLAEYTPIPGTQLFPVAEKSSPYPLQQEPLYQNNSIWPCYPGGFSWLEHRKWRALLKGN